MSLPSIVYRPIRPGDWPGALTFEPFERKSPQFQAGLNDTKTLLLYEVGRLRKTPDSRQIVVQLAIDETDLRADGQPKVRADFKHPGVIVSFDSRHGSLRYATDRFKTWGANLRAVALGLEALRKVDRYGIGADGEQYTGFRAIAEASPGSGIPTTSEAARALLESYGGLRAALKATHPDRGGGTEEFREVQAAREVLGL